MSKSNKCLYCYKVIQIGEQIDGVEFHKSCSRKVFDSSTPPKLEYTQSDMHELALRVIKTQKTVTGVQAKLSLSKQKLKDGSKEERFTIVGLWGQYILKPQTSLYQQLPEIEDLTMSLANLSKISTVKHSLIRLKSGELAYITKREDRNKGLKVHMEDMCQLTERQTEHKYKGSYEQIAKTIKKYSAHPGLDLVNFYEIVLFSFLTGNNDMHLKNFSLIKSRDFGYVLCPAYDLLASELVVEGDDEELALQLDGIKKRLKRVNFERAMKTSGLNEKAIDNVFLKFSKLNKVWKEKIHASFLSDDLKESYCLLIENKFKQLEML